MGIVQIIRRTDADIVNVGAAVAQLGVVPVEKFLFGKEGSLGKIAVHDAYAVAFIVGGDKVVTCVFDGFEVPGSNVATDTDYREVFHFCLASGLWLFYYTLFQAWLLTSKQRSSCQRPEANSQ